MPKKVKIALALGGGGARGLAHIGILRALSEYHIPIDLIVGSGIGAVIGAMYAQNQDTYDIERRIREFFTGEGLRRTGLHLFRRTENPENFFGQIAMHAGNELHVKMFANRISLMKENRLAMAVDELLGNGLIENTRIKFTAVATEIQSGETVEFREGSLRDAVKASSAIPGFVPPVVYRNKIYVEGNISAPIPILSAKRSGADFIIGINTGLSVQKESLPKNMIDIVFRSHQITMFNTEKLLSSNADFMLYPDIGNLYWADFEKIDEAIQAGIHSVKSSIDKLTVKLKKPSNKISGHI